MSDGTGVRRLVGKSFDGEDRDFVGVIKSCGGVLPSSVIATAEKLAQYGLRANQISELTGFPKVNTARFLRISGNFFTGRVRNSRYVIESDPEAQALIGAFFVCVDLQRTLNPSDKLTGAQVIASIETLQLRLPQQAATANWQDLVYYAMDYCAGKYRMVLCAVCNTHHIARADVIGDAACVTCRVQKSMTKVQRRKGGGPKDIVLKDCSTIPSRVERTPDRKKRMATVVDINAPFAHEYNPDLFHASSDSDEDLAVCSETSSVEAVAIE